jgi:hypothetical protein
MKGYLMFDNVKIYENFRAKQVLLNEKAIDKCSDPDHLLEAAILLGFDVDMDELQFQLVFDHEQEEDILGDFSWLQYPQDSGKTLFEEYREKQPCDDNEEKHLLDALLSAKTSLFRVESVSKDEQTLNLYDLLNYKEDICLTDSNLCEVVEEGQLLFFRLVSLNDLNMSSGFCCLFHTGSEEDLLLRYRELTETQDIGNDDTKRFIAFFQLFREFNNHQ